MKNRKIINDFGILSTEISYFLLVFEQRSINGAARKLSQDAGNISRSISKLEQSLGSRLFTRHKTGLNPTVLGENFYFAVLSGQRAFVENIKSQRGQKRIRLGFSSAVGYSHFSNKMAHSLVKNNFDPEFTIEASMTLIEMLKKRELDFALVHNPVKFPGLIARHIASESLVLACCEEKLQRTLLVNRDMLGLENILPTLAYEKKWIITDYFIIAKMLQENSQLMGILPESIMSLQKGLRIIRRFEKGGKITALTWPESVGLEFLKSLE